MSLAAFRQSVDSARETNHEQQMLSLTVRETLLSMSKTLEFGRKEVDKWRGIEGNQNSGMFENPSNSEVEMSWLLS